MNSRPSTDSLGMSDTQEREDTERPEDYENGDEENDDDDEDDQDDEEDGDEGDGDDGEEANPSGGSEIEKFAKASASGVEQPLQDYVGTQLSADGTVGKKRERSNAKAVECLDMDGNLVELFRSGMSASMKLGIPQGDISLCCRGLKPSVMGYKFRFYGETEEKQAQRLKKGFVLEGVNFDNGTKVELTRTTRASRGEYGQGRGGYDLPGRSLLDPPHVKVQLICLYHIMCVFFPFIVVSYLFCFCLVLILIFQARTWRQEQVKAGPFLVSKWIPNAPEPHPELQSRIPKNAAEAKLNKSKRRRTVNRMSIGSTAPSKYVYDEPI